MNHSLIPLYFPSNAESVTGVPTSRLTLSNDLHNLTSSQPQVSCNRISNLDTRKLCILQPVSVQQPRPLLFAQQNMLRNQLVVRNVDQQILLHEALDAALVRNGGGKF